MLKPVRYSIIAIAFYVCIITTGYCQSLPQTNVLVLNSYSREMQWTENQVQGIMSGFKQAGLQTRFFIEYLDWKYFPNEANLDRLRLLYKEKYAKRPIDIIMTTDDAALEFALKHRQELFSNAPVVFSGVYPESAARLTFGYRRVTGVQEVMDVNGTVALIKAFNPNINHVYLIYDSTESGMAAQEPLLRAILNMTPSISASDLMYSSYQEIIGYLSNATENCAVIMATYSRDRNGVVRELEQYLELFGSHSVAPIYVLYDYALGNKVVGGSVISGRLKGQIAAELAVRILNGENPDVVVPVNPDRQKIMLDYQQLMRYRLPLGAIPADSEVINRPQSFYEQYKRLIWGTWAVICFLSIAIIVLSLNIRQRKAAESSLKFANEELTATYEEVLASQEELHYQYEKLQSIQAEMHYLAYHDQLTGLLNRTALQERMSQLVKTGGTDSGGAVLFIDIDNFKHVNDSYGHVFGDRLLAVLANLVMRVVGDNGFIARMGGDEFVIVLDNAPECQAAARCAEQLKQLLQTPIAIGDCTVSVTFSIGLTLFPADGTTMEKLLKNADFAMYQAKEQGKNRYVFYNRTMEETALERMQMEAELRIAIESDQLELWYQPVINLSTGAINSFEALLRWQHPQKGIVPPLTFIGLAEKTGLIVPIGKQVLHKACLFVADLHAQGYDIMVTVNISVVQFVEDDFVPSVEAAIRQTGVMPQWLGFEITETVFMEQSQVLIEKLLLLKQLGITILLDDFGSGYSSLKYLNNLPIDIVKIDKAFIDRLEEKSGRRQLAEVIVELARHIDAKTVAEGVETDGQLARLREYKCDYVQGYLFSKPVSADRVCGLLGEKEER